MYDVDCDQNELFWISQFRSQMSLKNADDTEASKEENWRFSFFLKITCECAFLRDKKCSIINDFHSYILLSNAEKWCFKSNIDNFEDNFEQNQAKVSSLKRYSVVI